VLNSLPGEAISKSIECLGAYGRFLEIGKTDIYQNRAIGLYPFQNNLSYFAIDLDKMLREKPRLVRRLFLEVVAQLERGVYRPLPMTVFERERTAQAFRYMAQRKNTGKVIVQGGADSGAASPAAGASAYWITGGLGALGLETAKHLADRGATHLALFGRSEPSDAARAAIEALEAKGVRVAVARADVANRSDLDRAIRSLPEEMSRPTGVYHAAGVLDDGVVGQQSPERFERVMGPKAAGAWNLHEASSGLSVTEFVLFSSVASILGSPGQSNYAAANAFLDGLAAYRRAQGLPALSINWGPWAEVGMAARLGEEKLAGRGVRPMAPAQAIEAMRRLIEADATQAAVIDADWETVVGLYPAGPPALLKELAATPQKRPRGDRELRRRVEATPPEMRRAMLQAYFLEQIARVMEMESDKIDPDQPMNTLGLDSLMAIELKNGIESSLSISLPMAKFLEGPSAAQLSEMVVDLLAAGEPARPVPSEAAAP
jgi:NAD(P)-dependent dehydrogenase (short-subunit alcohol dehydrogenase family)/acyl carrier protein